ncbi:transcriptional regulator, TraR/DksA family [Hyphomicrobium denitrificans ATCC 51888]|uniref:RNA polymerase-binding transcription factor DksA n=1 Tax=Hyphomicrobium denitrificans (strain ATCC 51888 / DSM 1869 / NCIMB 11706 / TK 0415) TaxID=582899 RepID=D8JQH5_HYPDA|nr:RNA polymerase-binding protein DksA [Hyphomicrobium denitrificans]ADJ23929.1 transcriptional regulator, TraR/DksA family [Hyphomicrobium denitrificans ATCC 51888]
MSKTIAAKTAKGKSAGKKAVAKSAQSAKASKTPAGKPAADKKKTAAKPAPVKSSKVKTATAAKPATKKAPAAKVAAQPAAVPKPALKKSEGTNKKMAPRVKIADIVLPAGYKPSDDEPFMNDLHKAYFRKRLLDWKDEILRQTRETLAILHEDSTQHADLADRATSETDRATELRTRDRQRKLIAKIDAAVGRIEDGTYGYCEDTGEPIGLKRLDARPIATLSVEAQERHERRERVYREE